MHSVRAARALPHGLLRARVPGLASSAGLHGLAAGAACFALATTAAVQAGHVWGSETNPYLATATAAFLAYLLGLILLCRGHTQLAAVLTVATAIQLAPLAQPLLLSQDAGSYWDYGRIAAIHGGSPYQDPPNRYHADPAYPFVAAPWRDQTSAYGPLFTLISEGSAEVGGNAEDWSTWFYKTLGALSVLAAAAFAAALSPRPAFAAAAVGWNPLFAIHFGGGGHNDALMVALLLGALVLERRGRRQLSGGLWACAAAIKWIPLLLLPLWCARPRSRFGYAGFVITAAGLAAIATAEYGTAWLSALGPIIHNAAQGSRASLVHLAAAGAVLFTLAYVVLFRKARHGTVRLGLTATALLVTTPWLLPWYAIWALSLAAAEDDPVALTLSILVTGYMLIPALWI